MVCTWSAQEKIPTLTFLLPSIHQHKYHHLVDCIMVMQARICISWKLYKPQQTACNSFIDFYWIYRHVMITVCFLHAIFPTNTHTHTHWHSLFLSFHVFIMWMICEEIASVFLRFYCKYFEMTCLEKRWAEHLSTESLKGFCTTRYHEKMKKCEHSPDFFAQRPHFNGECGELRPQIVIKYAVVIALVVCNDSESESECENQITTNHSTDLFTSQMFDGLQTRSLWFVATRTKNGGYTIIWIAL